MSDTDASEFYRFVIFLDKVENKTTSPQVIQRHIEHLKNLKSQGKLVLCGPFTDHDSGMVVVKAKDKFEAIAIADTDPFVIEGVRIAKVWSWLLACEENNYLA